MAALRSCIQTAEYWQILLAWLGIIYLYCNSCYSEVLERFASNSTPLNGPQTETEFVETRGLLALQASCTRLTHILPLVENKTLSDASVLA